MSDSSAASTASQAALTAGGDRSTRKRWTVVSSRTEPMNWRMTPSPPVRATEPASGSRSPAMIRSRVVLPAPFSPTSAARAPAPMRKDTSSSSTRPSGNVCRTPLTST